MKFNLHLCQKKSWDPWIWIRWDLWIFKPLINIFNLIYSIIYSCPTLSHVTTIYWSWPWPCNFALITFWIWNHLPSKLYWKFYPYIFWRSGFFFLYCDSIFCLQRVIIKKTSSPIVAWKCTFYEQIMINRPAERPSNQ